MHWGLQVASISGFKSSSESDMVPRSVSANRNAHQTKTRGRAARRCPPVPKKPPVSRGKGRSLQTHSSAVRWAGHRPSQRS